MDWREALRARVTGLAGGRVYWGERPQASPLPAILLTAVSDDRPQTLKDWDLAPGRIQVDVYGSKVKDAWDLAETALATLALGDIGNGHVFSRADVAIGLRDMHERVGNITVFRVSFDLIIHHTETELIS